MKYVVNLDWVELYCEFDSMLSRVQYGNAESQNWTDFSVRLRPYGTRVYRYVSEISYHKIPFATLCYCPLSSKDAGGIMNPQMCHIKLDNYWCYRDDWHDVLKHALRVFRIKPKRLSRLDLACDLQYFQNGLAAPDLCRKLITRGYYKIHQPNWAAHGRDSQQLTWNSLSFGSKNSPVFTRFYNKTLELTQKEDKQYIRECWKAAELKEERDVWRIEFALTDTGTDIVDEVDDTQLMEWQTYDELSDEPTGERYKIHFNISLDMIRQRENVEQLFLYYAQHYGDIRKNTGQPRYKCPRLDLLPTTPQPFRPYQRPHLGKLTRTDKLVVKKMQEVMFDLNERNERFVLWNAINLYQINRRIEVVRLPEAEKNRERIYYMGDSEDEEKTLRIPYPIDLNSGQYKP